MARAQFIDSIIDNEGDIIPSATVAVYARGTVNLVTIYTTETLGTTKANPFSVTNGIVEFWAPAGKYDVFIEDTAVPPVYADRNVAWDSVPFDSVAATSFGTRASRPAAGAVSAGSFYYATDQDAMFVSDLTNWIRVGPQAGDIIWTAEAAARTGYILLQGQAWPGTTGIYADLFAKWGGANLPDMQGREFVAKGTHADVATLLGNDGVAVGSRRPKHKHTVVQPAISAPSHSLTLPNHTHPETGSGGSWENDQGAQAFGVSPNVKNTGNPNTLPAIDGSIGTPVATGGTVGPQTGSEPTDSPAYIVLQPQAKL